MAKKKTSQDLKKKYHQGKKDLQKFKEQRQELDGKIEHLTVSNQTVYMEYLTALALERGVDMERAILSEANRHKSSFNEGG